MAVLHDRPVLARALRGGLLSLSVLTAHLHAASAAASARLAAPIVTAADGEPALSRHQLHQLLRRSDLVAVVRVTAFAPATFNRATHTGTTQRTEFAVEEVLHGSRNVPAFALSYLGPAEGGAGPAVGTVMIVFVRHNAKDNIWEPADEVYAYAPSARLRQRILSEKR